MADSRSTTTASARTSSGTPNQVEPPKKEVQLLTLKVMRLTKPKLSRSYPVAFDPADSFPADSNKLSHAIERSAKQSIVQVERLPNFGLSEVFGLPQSFGSIFLGEVFCSYLSLHNDSTEGATDVSVVAELQTGNDKVMVTTEQPQSSLGPNESLDVVIKHEVNELGTHLLVCTVQYKNAASEPLTFRKYFRFQVYKPLDIKTMVYNIDNDVYLEAQIQNITQAPMHIQKVNIVTSTIFKTKNLNILPVQSNDGGDETVGETTTFDSIKYLNPQDVRQYLYSLSAKDPTFAAQALSATSIGNLEIVWRTNLGELGRLQTNKLPRTPPKDQQPLLPVSIDINVVSAPSDVVFGEGFDVFCRAVNTSDNTMDLTIKVQQEKTGNVVLAGVTNRPLGSLAPGASVDVHLDLIALSTGLQSFRGVGLYDKHSKRIFDFKLPQFFVQG
eukprot:m.145461 g.145461  ORF g.145461 m.145461 type:complete len:443 (+) comp30442_c0_seq2:1025-2353(+)